MRKTLAVGFLAACATGLVATSLVATPASAHRDDGPRVVGLTADNTLVTFSAASPGSTARIGRITGLKGDTKVVGIDFRVQDRSLYAVGDKGGVYTLSGRAKATKVSQLTVALQGTSFGVDFNPAANRLRVISDTGQNLRHNLDDAMGAPAAGTTATDGTLTNPPVPPATTGLTALGVTGAAYTNNDLSPATATTLFDVDTTADQVSVQSPANAGTLAPTGKLGIDAGPVAGFDISSKVRGGVTVANTAYAALNGRFYSVDVLTGQASLIGTFRVPVTDIAVTLG
ncbi:DUF4394 domain-containing protein [Nonomuraea sp. NPDC050556]|uniref:DUF4394 domain-containing protein n=1 Tax=Nonomuraea sp. NPDC050556 TaxID=3364369 RepID=UPI0037B21476